MLVLNIDQVRFTPQSTKRWNFQENYNLRKCKYNSPFVVYSLAGNSENESNYLDKHISFMRVAQCYIDNKQIKH